MGQHISEVGWGRRKKREESGAEQTFNRETRSAVSINVNREIWSTIPEIFGSVEPATVAVVAHRRAAGTESAGLSDEGVVERARRAQHLVARAIVGGKEGQCPIEAARPEVGGEEVYRS